MIRNRRGLAGLFLAVALIPCHGGRPSAPSPDATGILEGQVLFEGSSIPSATRVQNTTDPQHCGTPQSLENVVISAGNRGIKNAILSVKGVALPPGYQPQPSRLLIDNRQCRFEPHAAVLTTGSRIETTNNDPIFHSVHLYGAFNINLALGPRASKFVHVPRRPGYLIVKCDVHGWMQAFIRVDAHPFHAVSGEDGSFRIAGIPSGSYSLEVWHEYFGPQEVPIKIEPGATSHITVHYRDKTQGREREGAVTAGPKAPKEDF